MKLVSMISVTWGFSGHRCIIRIAVLGVVTGLFLSNENTIGPAVDRLTLVLREASRDR